MMQPMAGHQMVPASPAHSVQSNMSGYSADNGGVPLDYLMAPQQYQQHQAQQQQYTMQPYQQPPSPMHGNMQMPLQGPPTQAGSERVPDDVRRAAVRRQRSDAGVHVR